ncbi:UPF0561 protein C2orf68 homolog isoform X2 [Physeter macrocephalus]|uniref:UPF0561 protein C2orf68 homolog isoform X2 n=1 Tax=Physeter macrocephalus TaxID=9755 RepID=A0A455AZS3_PHYMC|nr:UPF0561 protein C2orf68 homolog isoform X2 [Physeter catodon]|eukprot:XP_028342155.1 UPF0561 protein C2orf68 homolog isoform X2 [Physeter catodon]
MSQRKKSPAREWKLRMPHCPPPRPARSRNSARWDIRPGWPFPDRRQGAGSKVERGGARSSRGSRVEVGAVEEVVVAAAPRTGAPDGSGAGARARALLQAWRAAGHEPRLRAPHPTEPARPVPPRPAPRLPAPAWPGPAVPDSRSAPRRDDYDKKVKQAAKEKARRRHTPAPTRPRKPDLQVYLPRHRDGSTHPSNPDREESGESSSSGSSEPEPPGHQLFCLEYEADSGDVTSVIVYQIPGFCKNSHPGFSPASLEQSLRGIRGAASRA